MHEHPSDRGARERLLALAARHGLDVAGGGLRRTSSRFCLGVEHGDYNGTELFGVGTDRFLWIAYRPNERGEVRLVSGNFESDGVVRFKPGHAPPPGAAADSWARFPFGVDWVMRRAGRATGRGFDAVVWGDIPGGGMSRSASLSLNLLLTCFEVNGHAVGRGFEVVDLARQVENDYIGAPCGVLDQTMIYFARAGMGTHYKPRERAVEHVPLGADAADFRIVSLDTGTERPGLEKSTYAVRVRECREAVALLQEHAPITCLADACEPARFDELEPLLRRASPQLADRLVYLHAAQRRFPEMLRAWRRGDVARVGALFRADGHGLRDHYRISGPELETMCDIARTVEGVYGERMLGGGDKGAAGALVAAAAVEPLRRAVATAYPRSHPEYNEAWAVHACATVDGVAELPGL